MLETQLRTALAPLVDRFSGDVSLAVHRFADGFRFGLNAEWVSPAASLIKLPILVEALRQVEEGRLRLEQRTRLTRGEVVGGTGVLQALESGLDLTLRDLLTLMIILSDNTATNMVLELTGQDEVNDWCRAQGLGDTWLSGKLALPESRRNEAQRRGEVHRTSPVDMLELLVRLESGRLTSGPMTEVAVSIMKQQRMSEALARYLPTDPELDPGAISVASKSGCLRGVWNDAGIVYDARGRALYALVVMTSNAGDRGYGWEQEGMMLIANTSGCIFNILRAASPSRSKSRKAGHDSGARD